MKRKRDKYNPYKLLFDQNNQKYIIIFKDSQNINFSVEVTEEIYFTFDSFELEDKSQMNKYDRHIEHSKITEVTLNKRAVNKECTIEEVIFSNIEKEQVHKAILKLPEIQRRRIKMYFFEELTQKEIANREGASIRAVQYSIKIGLEKLKKLLEETS